MTELISVIVTTYNREDALDAVLRSLERQSDAAFEVIVADDGSGAATAALINRWKATSGHNLQHVWHNDQGFRAAEFATAPSWPRTVRIIFFWTAIASCARILLRPIAALPNPAGS